MRCGAMQQQSGTTNRSAEEPTLASPAGAGAGREAGLWRMLEAAVKDAENKACETAKRRADASDTALKKCVPSLPMPPGVPRQQPHQHSCCIQVSHHQCASACIPFICRSIAEQACACRVVEYVKSELREAHRMLTAHMSQQDASAAANAEAVTRQLDAAVKTAHEGSSRAQSAVQELAEEVQQVDIHHLHRHGTSS